MRISDFYTSDESITHQYDPTFTAVLDNLVEKILDKHTVDEKGSKGLREIRDLEKLLSDRFNVAIEIRSAPNQAAVFMPRTVVVSHPTQGYIPNWIRWLLNGEYNKILDDTEKRLRGGDIEIDYEKARFSKSSKVKAIMYYDFNWLYSNFTCDKHAKDPRVISGIILHEVGHIFEYMKGITLMTDRNRVMSNYINDVAKKGNGRKYRLQLIESIEDPEARKVLEGSEKDSRAVFGIKYAKAVVKDFQNRELSGVYNIVAMEDDADQFAARFGYSAELASFFQCIEMNKSVGQVVLLNLVLILSLLDHRLMKAISSLQVTNPIIATLIVAYLIYLVLISFTDYGHYQKDPHDTSIGRYEKLRLETINRLNSISLPKKEKERLIEEIDYMSEYLKLLDRSDMMKKYDTLMGWLIAPVGRFNETKKIERLLADLTHNELSVLGEKFKNV